MHTVDRGPEPPRLEAVRKKLTPKWVAHYRDKKGKKPTDDKWRGFQAELSRWFFGLCGYCEADGSAEVDHFRPKSTFPERVYVWGNWVLACHDCNNKKGGDWPPGGYVDPCAKSRSAQPESYFDFDTETAEIVARPGLTPARRRRASSMIKDLDLNAFERLRTRKKHLEVVSGALRGRTEGERTKEELVRLVTSRETRLSSITRAWLRERGHRWEICSSD